jgi:predicted AAA+ superfamily ATPase
LIDEWQLAPEVWNAVRREIDTRATPGQFILTGSSVPRDDVTRHSGAGRILRVTMEPMTLAESGLSSGEVSLRALFNGDEVPSALGGLTVPELVEAIVRGGWPGLRQVKLAAASRVLTGYVDDISRLRLPGDGEVSHDPVRVQAVLRSLARNTANELPVARIAVEAADAGERLSDQTVRRYLDGLRRVHVLKDQPAWGTHLRARVRLIKQPKRHLTDPSLAVAALGISERQLLQDVKALGFFFESLVVRDLRVFANALDGEVFHYRDSSGLEVDAVIQLRSARWGAIEVKMPAFAIDQAAANLLALRGKLPLATQQDCAFLAVVTSNTASYQRPDGVHVISVSHLGA